MKRVLITGMSGIGKSTVVKELAARGYGARDLDDSEWSEWLDADPSDALTPAEGKDWVWREDRVRALLSKAANKTVFISGCAQNMATFFPLIDVVVLLSAPVATIMERLAVRTSGGYGHVAEERQKVAHLISVIEPLLRKSADYEIDTRRPVDDAVDKILQRVV